MTGYAQGRFTIENFTLFVSIKSLNHRYLEIGYKGTVPAPRSRRFSAADQGTRASRQGGSEPELFEYDQNNWYIQLNESQLEAIIASSTASNPSPGLTLTSTPFCAFPWSLTSKTIATPFRTDDPQITESLEEVVEAFLSPQG
jgi:hypothetical protein